MAPLELKGQTLGEKHRHYNRLIKEAIANHTPIQAGDLNSGENDVAHFMKIDIATHNRDVEYILKVLTCEDMLYISRAIKQSTWLITDQQYAHIINPTYLKTHLFPEMTAAAKTKLLHHIRLHLIDEPRAEQFFDHEIKSSVKIAVKWLPKCSKEFIVIKVKQYLLQSYDCRLFKRLCEKCPDVVKLFLDNDVSYRSCKLERVKFLLHVMPEAYLTVVEKQDDYNFPRFGVRTTHLLMQKYSDRVINNFGKYHRTIHLPTFVQYLKKEDIKDFLFTQAKQSGEHVDDKFRHFATPENIKLFLNAMTEEQRSQFLDKVFINKVHSDDDLTEGSENFGIRKFYLTVTCRSSEYVYYDFNTAFEKITKAIRTASQKDKIELLFTLIECAALENYIPTVLSYYHEKFINDPPEYKRLFLEILLNLIDHSKINMESWKTLDNIFMQMEIYTDPQHRVPGCMETTILCKILYGERIPEEIEKELFKMNLNKILKTQKCKCKEPEENPYNSDDELQHDHGKPLSAEHKEKVINYLYDIFTRKIESHMITNEKEFKEGIRYLELLLNLVKSSEKELSNYPWILDKIRQYLKMKKDHSWKTSMASVYNIKKQWRKLMFEESLELCPSDVVCVNALKHDVQLLSLERAEVNALRCDNKVSLQRVLSKLRVYWPQSLAADWTARYKDDLKQQGGLKAVVRGLCSLLPRQQLLEIIHEYAPKQDKIVYKEIDATVLGVQRQLAKNMLIARPQPSPDAILLYAKGDYLQYALPSLLAIFNNANENQTRNAITQLLAAPASIQKHGMRIVFSKYKPEEALGIFRDIWMRTTNCTIRAIVFRLTFSLLTKDKKLEKDLWDLLFFFIDNLSYEEDKTIYENILQEENLDKMPKNLRGVYVMKILKFVTELISTFNDTKEKELYEWRMTKIIGRITNFMECVPTDFMINILSEFIENTFLKKKLRLWNDSERKTLLVFSAFVLCTKSDKTQVERYNLVLDPMLHRCISLWDQVEDGKYFIVKNVNKFLTYLRCGLKDYVHAQQMDNPLGVFEEIQKTLNQLPVPDNYVILMKWKLTVELTRILHEKGFGESWDDTCVILAHEFGKKCLELLKNDVISYFPCIYTLFCNALDEMFKDFMPDTAKFIVYQTILQDAQFVQAYLAVIKMYPRYFNEKSQVVKQEADKVRKLLDEHPSIEVKMHINHKFVD